jgi:hypothetical protein
LFSNFYGLWWGLQGNILVRESHIDLDLIAPYEQSEFVITGSEYEHDNPEVDREKYKQLYEVINDLVANVTVDLPRNVWIKGKGIKSEQNGALN